MALGTDLKEFVNAFIAGNQMVTDSRAKKAQSDQAEASAAYQRAEAAAVPAREKYQEAQAAQAQARADWYDRGAPRTTTTIKGGTDAAAGDWSGGQQSAIPDDSTSSSGAAPGDMLVPGPDTSTDDTSEPDTSGDGSDTPDVSNYVPTSTQTSAIPAGQPTQTVAPQMGALQRTIAGTAAQLGVDPAYALATSDIETGGTFNPMAQNPQSGASGLFQFVPQTAKNLNLQDPTNPVAATHAFAQLTSQNTNQLASALGRAPNPGELYLAHQQGPTAAAMLLTNPQAPAINVLTAAYQKSGVQNPQAFAAKALAQNGGSAGMTAGQFANKWIGTFNQRYAKYTGGGQQAVPGAPDASGYAATPQGNSALAAINTAAGPANPIGGTKGLIVAGQQNWTSRFLPSTQAAVPAPGAPQPNVAAHRAGDTRAPYSVVEQLYNQVDPDHKMTDAQRVAAAFDFINNDTSHTPQQKAAAAGDLVGFYQTAAAKWGYIAQHAAQQGDLPGSVKAAVKFYNQVPDGLEANAIINKGEDGSPQISVKLTDVKSGWPVYQQVLSPDQWIEQTSKMDPHDLFNILLHQSAVQGDKTPLTDNDKSIMDGYAQTGIYPADKVSSMSTAGRTALNNMSSHVQPKLSSDSNPDTWKAAADTVVQSATDSLTAGPMANMQTPAMKSTVAALADPAVTGDLKSSITDYVKQSDGRVVPEELGRDIADLVTPGGLSIYQVTAGKGATTFTNRTTGRTFSLPTPVVENVKGVLAKVQQDELARLKGDQDASAQAKARNTPNPAVRAKADMQMTGHVTGGPQAQPPSAIPAPAAPASLGQRLQQNLTTPGGIPMTLFGYQQ